MADLLECLIKLSEKAGKLARIIRSENTLFKLLVQRKDDIHKNDDSFVHDFKTLGDVLIQEMIRYEIQKQFTNLAERVFGEETNKFTNTLGETVTVSIRPTVSETADVLNKVLNNNKEAAHLLAKALHEEVSMDVGSKVTNLTLQLDLSNIGIWIDPIDGTSEFIKGNEDSTPKDGIYSNGLQCALVLIGVFDTTTGEPVMGVVNQPFAENKDKTWQGRVLWGVCHKDVTASSFSLEATLHDSVDCIVSSAEKEEYTSRLERVGRVCTSSGAGYKMLCVIEQFTDAYFVSRGQTYKWDTCAPHALLKSVGGGIVDFEVTLNKCRKEKDVRLSGREIAYHKPDSEGLDAKNRWSNSGGLVAYRSKETLQKIFDAFL
ncbi:inositol polyphosphate 1-phosphatase-like [Apostichopus japonicus]|uniref:inositol polyphosphate 1-phosphatase-like n=1 Tax=Stichopus japonicus TaxID=307972 RepID=UPI003AB3E57D